MGDGAIEADDDLVGTILRLAKRRSRARSAAFFVPRGGEPCLVASHGIDAESLADVRSIWKAPPPQLHCGALFQGLAARAYVVVPAIRGGQLVGLLYLELGTHTVALSTTLMRMMTDIMAEAARPDATLKLPSEDPRATAAAAKASLLFLLESQDGNISRAARMLGVARATVYNRLQRHGLKPPGQRRQSQRRPAID